MTTRLSFRALVLFIFVSLLMTACISRFVSNVSEPADDEYGGYKEELMYGGLEESFSSVTGASSKMIMSDSFDSPIVNKSIVAEGEEQKVIKTGSLSLHVEDVRKAVEQIEAAIGAWSGTVTYANVTRGASSYSGSLTVQVEADYFEAAMNGLKDMALYVESENSNAEDVTRAYMDLEARLSNAREEEEQYLELLNRSGDLSEVLEVTRAISDVRYEIESYESQINYYDGRINYSSISIYLTEDESVSAVNEKWRPGGTVKNAFSDWFVFLQDVLDSMIYLVIFGWPFAIAGLIVWRVWRKRRVGKKRKK